jgi:hypothetical protein
MNWVPKARPGSVATSSSASAAATRTSTVRPGPSVASSSSGPTRISNGLKEFLWLISDIPHGRILDLGPVWQSTVSFFIEKGYRVSAEDLLRTWKDFLTTEEERLRLAPVGEAKQSVSAAILADKFLETALQYPEDHFHGVLAWDLLDYFDSAAISRLAERLTKIMHPGGALLALFHSRAVDRFHRYRVVDGQTVELVPAPTLAVHAHVFQNREILGLFTEFRSSKSFVGRDQVREGLFVK